MFYIKVYYSWFLQGDKPKPHMHKHALLHVKKPAELKGKIHTPKGKTNKKKKNSGGQAGWVLGGKERK